MARFDIMPFDRAGGPKVRLFRLNASETFVTGEPVSVNADGELTESADDPVDADLMGIAAQDGDTAATNGLSPRRRFGQFTDSGLVTTGDLIPVWLPTPQDLFITTRFSAAGSAFGDASPAVADLGDEVGLSLISGVWGVDQGASNNTCRIMDILDANGLSIQLTARTGTAVVFAIVAHQNVSLGTADAPVA